MRELLGVESLKVLKGVELCSNNAFGAELRAISVCIGKSYGATARLLHTLKVRGYVVGTSWGRWRLTDKGKLAISHFLWRPPGVANKVVEENEGGKEALNGGKA